MKIGIIGNGFVGKSIYKMHHLKHDVFIHDIVPERSTNTLDELKMECELIFICVPTVWNGSDIDLSIIHDILIELYGYDGDIVVKSTIPVGTIEKWSYRFALKIVFSPEFLTERRSNQDAATINYLIMGGYSRKLQNLYKETFGNNFNIVVTGAKEAEFVKYMRNCFYATKVTFMNDMYEVSENQDIDWFKVVDLFRMDSFVANAHLDVPGHDGKYGYGGKCFPKDVNAMIKSGSRLMKFVNKLNTDYRAKE